MPLTSWVETETLCRGQKTKLSASHKSCPALCHGQSVTFYISLKSSLRFLKSLINNLESCFSGVGCNPPHAMAESKARKDIIDE